MKAEYLKVAKIGKTVGFKGDLKIYSLSGEFEHLFKMKRCFVLTSKDSERKELKVDSVTKVNDTLLIHFNGYDSPEKSKTLSGGVIILKRDQCIPLEEGEYYLADLFDMDVLYNGEKVGVVKEMLEGGQSMLLEVEALDKTMHLVPLMKEYVSDVDIEKNTLSLLMRELLD